MAKVKMPRIVISMTLYYKDPPASYHGLVQENWTFGKTEFIPLRILIVLVTKKIVEFYLHCIEDTLSNINENIKRAGEYIASLKLEEKKE